MTLKIIGIIGQLVVPTEEKCIYGVLLCVSAEGKGGVYKEGENGRPNCFDVRPL